MRRLTMISVLPALTASSATGQQRRQGIGREHPPKLDGAKVEAYKASGDGKDYIATVCVMDEFLAEQGFLKGKPTVK